MAVRLLGTKLSKRIFPCHDLLNLKGLRPLHARPKTDIISSVKGRFASGRAERLPYHQASFSRPCSPWKVQAMPGTSLIHGKRNFASGGPSTTENVLKMSSFSKSSSAQGDECPEVEAVELCECDYCSSQRNIEKFLERLRVFGTWMFCMGTVWNVFIFVQQRRKFKALDGH